MSDPKLTAQVVVWNNAATLPALLDCCTRQTMRDVQYLFLDNHSDDDSACFIERTFPQARVVRNTENKGFSAAHNQGLRMCPTDYTALVNPDMTFPPDTFDRLIAELERRPDVASIGTKLLRKSDESGIVDSAGIFATRYGEFLNRGEGERDQGQYDTAQEVFGVNGAFIVLRRTALESIRCRQEFLDEDLFAYKDDIDLAWRLRLAGWKNWYVPDPSAEHVRAVRHEAERSVAARRARKRQAIKTLSFRNHWMVLLKNDRISRWFLPLPRVLFYEAAKLLFLLLFEPRTLKAIPQLLRLMPGILHKRRIIQAQRTVPFHEVERWFV